MDLNFTKKQRELLQNCYHQLICYGGAAGGGKIVAEDGVVLTPFGWKKGRDLKVGQLICHPNGSIQKIIQIHPKITLPKWRVYFRDGTYTDVAEGHLWQAWKSDKIKQVVETKVLKEWLDEGSVPYIPVNEEIKFNNNNSQNNMNFYKLGVSFSHHIPQKYLFFYMYTRYSIIQE